MKRFEEIRSINAAIVHGHKILIYLVYYMRLMLGRISLTVELLLTCMSSVRATMKNCQTIKR